MYIEVQFFVLLRLHWRFYCESGANRLYQESRLKNMRQILT